MRIAACVTALMLSLLPALPGAELDNQVRQLSQQGKSREAMELLRTEVRNNPNDLAAARSLAEFLDQYGAAARSEAYAQYWALIQSGNDQAEKQRVLRRLAVLSLEEGKRDDSKRYLALYEQAGGSDLRLPTSSAAAKPLYTTIQIPGPLNSFARMTAIASDLEPEQILSALARNIVISGYRSNGPDGGMGETEYLRLIFRYLELAKELEKMAGEDKQLEITTCESTETGELLKALGYRMRGGCGGEVVLETVNPTRAFVTVDSGFPLADLESALRTNRPFRYDMTPTQLPILYGADYWQLKDPKNELTPIEMFFRDPALCRLYLSLAKLESNTAEMIRKEIEIEKLRAFSHVIDFYGGMFHVVNGKVVVPGGQATVKKWESMVGSSVDKPSEFFMKLIAVDDGWLACYYDALSRIEGPVKNYLTQPDRMERFYDALRGRITSPGPARPVFRANTDMLIFTHRLRLNADGQPHVPGTLAVWKEIFTQKDFVDDKKLRRAAPSWQSADDLIAALFGLSRSYSENVPLKMFIAVSEMNRLRNQELEPATVKLLVENYKDFASQYSLLAEANGLSDEGIQDFLNTARATLKIRNDQLRGDTVGSLQGLLGLWQIFTRHGLVTEGKVDSSFRELLALFNNVENHQALFGQSRQGVDLLLRATGAPANQDPHQHLVRLLAGSRQAQDSAVLSQQVDAINQVVSAQRLLTLTEIFTLADQLESAANGGNVDTTLLNQMTAKIARIQSMRSSLSMEEKNALSFGRFTEDHIDRERKVRLRAEVDKRAADPAKLRELLEDLAPHVRDTLVGLNYAHYAPPGGQILLTNSQFVRYHDFNGLPGQDFSWAPTELVGVGWSATSGGRLMGSLSELPYALAQAEQNFLVPNQEQALIWGDLVPQVLLTATVPRWWQVSPAQQHYVALLQRAGHSLIAESILNEQLRAQLFASLDRWSSPSRVSDVRQSILAADYKAAVDQLMPAELFRVAYDLLEQNAALRSPIYDRIRDLQKNDPNVALNTISDLFGTPKPALTHSYRPELLGLRTMPTLMGYSSRLMAETWESSALYWAELSDRLLLQPEELNLLVPQWTRETVEGIFATHLEDWPALLRSMRRVGESKLGVKPETTVMAGGQ